LLNLFSFSYDNPCLVHFLYNQNQTLAYEKVDVAVIEVGLGGRLDSTNVITPEVSLITNISWDHMDLLGDTLQKIAQARSMYSQDVANWSQT